MSPTHASRHQSIATCPVTPTLAQPALLCPAASAPTSVARRRLSDLPGPKRLPWLGNLLELSPERLNSTLERWARQHGPMCVYCIGRQPVLLVSEASLAKALLRGRTGPVIRMSRLTAVMRSENLVIA